jgi:regulatory protein
MNSGLWATSDRQRPDDPDLVDAAAPASGHSAEMDVSLGVSMERETQQRRVAMDAAQRLLAQREQSAEELRTKLTRKGHSAEMAQCVIEELQRLDLQSDERFLDSFFRGRLSKGHGPVRIRHDLNQKGIAESLVEEVLTQPAEFWLELAEQVRVKRFGEELPVGDSASWTAQARFLARRGFPSDLIYRVLGSRY